MAFGMAGLTVYNMPPSPPNWDRVGVFYIAFCITWTTLLVAGMIFCAVNHRVPILRVRGLPLSFSAIALLHVYWILGQITYPIGATMPTVLAYDVQFFGMGVYFPLGIALFQASNLRFLHVARMQKQQFANPDLRIERKCNGAETSWLCRIRNMDYMKRTLCFITIGMVLQFIITVAMWLACAKYHPTYGIPGTEIQGATVPEQIVFLGRGWEWWPSMLWQVIWTWIAAPILIWKAWGVRDTMGWRTQTIACCLSSLHATPMFLIASYVPSFAKVNVYFTPSQWIHLSIMMWEIFTVFVPIFQVIRVWSLRKKTSNSIAKYGSSAMTTVTEKPPSSKWSNESSSTLGKKDQSVVSFDDGEGDRLYTMDALEHVLSKNPIQLQEFAALSDFSGENIAFLSELAVWKSRWSEKHYAKERSDTFNEALWIYADFISTHDAEFPLNLSSKDLKHLEAIFEKPTRALLGEKKVNHTSPFESDVTSTPLHEAVADRGVYTGEIPDGFDMDVFNHIQDHIKYLVLTNTFPKFVESMRRRSTDTERSDFSGVSDISIASWISKQRTKLQSFI
ncbi:hypothetical protein N7541_004358 [Penicillium brevicompactum]|uniref:RGS domain-containing protein n=1 Tax=Penicillium brevicompactum TaxID=5074 RepID=A0A9W9RBH2_PENBR|nr:hypothetical protein N7541_004358 [Penicillium brevicompactum]